MSYYDMDLPSRPVVDCISVITSAADTLLTYDPRQPPDYIGYTTILCIHLQLAASSHSDEHQDRILKALLTVLLECPEAIEHIGWDLVGPLQDFVEFEPKTQDGGPQKWGTLGIIYDLLGKYGNAQEVWLKIGEAMSNITFDDHNIGQPAIEGDDPSTTDDDDSATTWLMGKTAARKKFALLMRLAGATYPRIKARKPSRFLADLLPLILRAYRLTASHCSGSEMLQVTQTVHDFVACLEPGQPKPKPPLPPRAESSYIAAATEQPSQHALTDLVGETDTLSTTPSVPSNPSDAVADQRPPPSIDTEGKVQIKLVQAFLTYISEEYMNALGVGWEMTGIVGLCLAARFHDLIFPEKLVPGRETVTDVYQRVQVLKDRESGMSLIEQMRLRLNLEVETLLDVCTRTPEGDDSEDLTMARADMMQQEPKDSPDDPSEITFSTIGCSHLLAFRLVWPLIHGASSHLHQPAISICDHVRLWHTLKQLGDDGEEVGKDDPAMRDAFVSLGLLAFYKYSGEVPQANEPDCNGDSAEAIRKSLVPGYFRVSSCSRSLDHETASVMLTFRLR